MTFINKILDFFKNKKYVYGVIAAVFITGGIFIFNNKNGAVETITIAHTDFVNQVSVSGKVAAGESVDLGFSQGGRISSIQAKVGDMISYGRVIASIENGDLRAGLEQKQAALQKEQTKLKSLQIGTRPEQLAVTESSLLSAQVSFNQSKRALINAINDAYTKSDDAVKNKVDQFFRNPLSSNPFIVLYVNDNSLILSINQERLSSGQILSSWEESISKINSEANMDEYILEAGNNMNQLKSFLAKVSLIVNNPDVTQAGSSSVPSSWKADTSVARLSLDTAISAFSSAVTSYRNAQTELTVKQNNLKLEQAGSTIEDIEAEKAAVKGAEADVANAQAMLEKTLILAPFSGQITKMDAKVGEIVSPNVSLISMMSVGTFQIESYVPEVSIAQIKLEDEARVTLDAYGESVSFNAKVVSIDPAETIRDGVSTYKIKLQFREKDDRIKSGMTANVSITIFNKPNVIVIPGGVVFDKDGKKFVQIKNSKKISDREVVLGSSSSLGQVEVISGLLDGDMVMLNPNVGRQESQTSNVK